MRTLRVDFTQSVGATVFATTPGHRLTVGEQIAVYDTDTDTYVATVESATADRATLVIDFTRVVGDL